MSAQGVCNVPFDRKLSFLVRRHKRGTQPKGPQTQTPLRSPADIMHQRHRPLIQFLLIKELVLNHVRIDEIAHARTCVPSDIVSVNVDLAQELEHLCLVRGICLCARRGGRQVLCVVVLVAVGGRDVDSWEGEAVCDFESAVDFHADEGACCDSREGLGGVFDDFHHHLVVVSMFFYRGRRVESQRTSASSCTP